MSRLVISTFLLLLLCVQCVHVQNVQNVPNAVNLVQSLDEDLDMHHDSRSDETKSHESKSEESSKCCDTSDGAHFECTGCEEFPTINDGATSVTVTGGNFCDIPADAFPKSVEAIEITNCLIDDIEEHAFNALHALQQISFVNAEIRDIKGEAFIDLHFPVADAKNMESVQASNLQFVGCNIRDIDESAFKDIRGLAKFLFEDTNIRSTDDDAFEDLAMSDGDVKLMNVNVQQDCFPKMDNIDEIQSITITSLNQQTLSSDIIGFGHYQHVMSDSTFTDIDEDLLKYTQGVMTFVWSDVYIYCGEDIDWLMENQEALHPDMLNGLVCSGPGSLAGQQVAHVSESEWKNQQPNGSLSITAIILITVLIIIKILLLIVFVVFCCRRNKKPTPVVAPAASPPVVIVDEKKSKTDDPPPPYASLGRKYGHNYDNPTAPPYDAAPGTGGPRMYDNAGAGGPQLYDNTPAGVHSNPSQVNPAYSPEAPTYASIYDTSEDNVTPSAPHVTYDNGVSTVSLAREGAVYDSKE